MSGKLKLMIGGLTLGILLIFAFVGIKSVFSPSQPAVTADSDWQQPPVMPNANIPSPDDLSNNNIFTRPLNDKPQEEDTGKVELVGERPPPEVDAAPVKTPVKTPPVAPPVDEQTAAVVPDKTPVEEVTDSPKPPAPQPPVSANTGKLEIVTQTETGKALKANVYVQQTSGANVDGATYTSKAAFSLKPGMYKITVRAEGYGSLTRNINVPGNAVVNEIFPLTRIATQTPPPAPVVPVAQAPVHPTPPPPAAAGGKLRIVALSADDGSPIKVNFTISRLDGSVVERINNVSLAELNLPAQEFVVNFDFQGFQGYKSLTVQPGQTITHTFNIRGASQAMPNNQPLPGTLPIQQQPQQSQNVEDILMQRLQEELQKRMSN